MGPCKMPRMNGYRTVGISSAGEAPCLGVLLDRQLYLLFLLRARHGGRGGGHGDRSAGRGLRRGGHRRGRRGTERGADAGPGAAPGPGDRRGRAAQRAGRGVHGLLGRDGMPPGRAARARPGRGAPLRRPGGGRRGRHRRPGRTTGSPSRWPAAGRCRARRLLVATGLADELPELPGLRERWGRDVVHCPYCHGWEVRDRAIGVLASGPRVGAPGAAVGGVPL